MARGRGRPSGMGEWVQKLGEQIGTQLGQIIAASVQRTLEKSIDVGEIARRLGAGIGSGRRGRRPATGEKAVCSEEGCGRPVLAKGLCRSHYYRASYRSKKSGGAQAGAGRGQGAAGKADGPGRKKRGAARTEAAEDGSAST